MHTRENKIDTIKLMIFAGKYGTIIILFAMIFGFGLFLPAFRSPENLLNLLGQTAILAIFASGMTCCMKMGDFDLSIGGISAVTGIVVAKMLLSGFGVALSVLFGIFTGAFAGLVNGILVAYVGLSAFVCTLATMSIILGLNMAITKGISIWDLPSEFAFIGRGDLYGVPNRFIIAFGFVIVIWFIHTFTRTGRRMEAIGGNANAARLSGINVECNRLKGYLFSGVCSAVAGIILASSTLSAASNQGVYYLLDAFGACFIGAATVRIGQFHIWGTFVGVLIVVVAVNGLVICMVPGYLNDMIKGMILLLAILLSGTVGRFIRG